MRTVLMLVLTALLGIHSGGAVLAQESTGQEVPVAELVNLNRATTMQLQTLPGVGPALAMRIIEYREANGGFERVEDVMNVRGVGETTFLRIRHLLTVTTPEAQSAERR